MKEKIITYVKQRKLFIALLIFFIGYSASFINLPFMWDGALEYMVYIAPGIHLSQIPDRASFTNSLVYGIPNSLNPGSFRQIRLIALSLGIICLIAFNRLLQSIFGENYSKTEITLLTFFMGFNPVFFAHSYFAGNDYNMTVFFVLTLLAIRYDRMFLAALSGLFMVFTKETGLILYFLTVSIYFLFKKLPNIIKRFKKVIFDGFILSTPIIPSLYLMLIKPLHPQNPGFAVIWGRLMNTSFGTIYDPIFQTYFVLNFSWIFNISIILAILKFFLYRRYKKKEIIEIFHYVIPLIIFVLIWSVVRLYNNPRYVLPTLPLMIILFAWAGTILLPKTRLRTGIYSAILLLLIVSTAYTIDPISKGVFGTFKFGSHDMLQRAKYTEYSGYGVDQLIYNNQFTKLHDLTLVILNENGWGEYYTAIDFIPTEKPFNYDRYTGLALYRHEKFYHIKYPNQIQPTHSLNKYVQEFYDTLKNNYTQTPKNYSRGGYSIEVIEYKKIKDPNIQ